MLQGFLNLNTPNYKLKIKKIKTILNSAINNNKLQDFDLNKLKIITIPFAGGIPNKYTEIYREIYSFLTTIGVDSRYDKRFAFKYDR